MKLGPPHVCFVQIGHYGDCINMMPVAWLLHKQGKTVHWFLFPEIKREILKACSYVNIVADIPIKAEGERLILRKMVASANERFENVIVCSHRESAAQGALVCQSYNREGWHLAGMLHEFDNSEARYVIDRYDWAPCNRAVKPVVVNLTSGQSSPFGYGETLLKKIHHAFPGMIEDIGALRLPRFLDLLPIIKSAALFVSIDTGTLWLSEFLPEVPTIAIVNHAEWSGSVLHRKLDARISYREVQADPRTIISAVERSLRIKANPGWEKIGEPVRIGTWPEVFRRGKINGESDMALRYAAIKAWREVLGGAPPCMFFDQTMKAISNRIGMKPNELIELAPASKPHPDLP